MITSKFCIQNPTVCDNRYFAFFFRLGLDNIVHAAEMKQRKEGSVQKMRAALKDKEKAEKVLGKVTAQVETLADAQFAVGPCP